MKKIIISLLFSGVFFGRIDAQTPSLFVPNAPTGQAYIGPVQNATGNVGIGIPTPVELLHVYSTGQYPRISVQSTSSTGAPGFDIRDASGTPKFTWHYDIGNGFMGFFQSGVGNRMIINNNGNVGIGTIQPQAKLEVNGDANIGSDNGVTTGYGSKLSFLGASTNGDPLWLSRYNTGANQSELRVNIGDDYGQSQDMFVVGTHHWNGGEWHPHLAVQASGNVGIGTTDPTNKLEVRSSSDFPLAYIRQDKNAGGSSDVFFLRDDRGYAGINTGTTFKVESWKGAGISTAGTLANFITKDNGVQISRLLIDNTTGNVGIGTSSPKVKLDLGDLRMDVISSFPAEGSVAEGTWGNYIVGNINSGQKLRLGVANDNYTRAEIFIDNGNRPDGTISLKTINGGGGAQTRLFVNGDGNVGIGTTSPDAKLAVKGTIHTQEVKVDLNGAVAPDYVFEPDYKLLSLEEIKSYIEKNKHLPEVPSAKEMETNGVNVSEMNMLLLKKIEELTLYVLKQNQIIETQSERINKLETKLNP